MRLCNREIRYLLDNKAVCSRVKLKRAVGGIVGEEGVVVAGPQESSQRNDHIGGEKNFGINTRKNSVSFLDVCDACPDLVDFACGIAAQDVWIFIDHDPDFLDLPYQLIY